MQDTIPDLPQQKSFMSLRNRHCLSFQIHYRTSCICLSIRDLAHRRNLEVETSLLETCRRRENVLEAIPAKNANIRMRLSQESQDYNTRAAAGSQ